MDGSRVLDFSIERILSPQFGHKPPVTAFSPELQMLSEGCGLDSGNMGPPAPVPVGLQQYQGMTFGEGFYPYPAGFHHTEFPGLYSNSGVYLHISSQDSTDPQQLARCHGFHPAGVLAQPHIRQKARMRTVFTDSQTKQLETLFELTDYPAVEARAELAKSTGLSEETVRIWFKNRRARKKRQRSGSKTKSPSPPRSAGADTKLFTSFL